MKALEKNLAVWARRVRKEANKLGEELEQAKAELMKAAKGLETAREGSGRSRHRPKAGKSRGARGGRGEASHKGPKGR